jgi:hypothetical protein
LLGYNFALFIVLSIVTRGLRFFVLAAILNKWGDPLRQALERHFAIFMGLILVAIVGGFWLAAHMF